MNCYKCGQPFALGWWCVNCKWTKDSANRMKNLEDALNRPNYEPYIIVGICASPILFLLIYQCIFG